MAAWTWSSNSAVAARAAVRDRRSASSAPHSPVGVVRFHAAAARARLPDASPHRHRHSTSAAGFAPSRTLRYADWFNLYRPLNCYDRRVGIDGATVKSMVPRECTALDQCFALTKDCATEAA